MRHPYVVIVVYISDKLAMRAFFASYLKKEESISSGTGIVAS